jgi:hypothetical protein
MCSCFQVMLNSLMFELKQVPTQNFPQGEEGADPEAMCNLHLILKILL